LVGRGLGDMPILGTGRLTAMFAGTTAREVAAAQSLLTLRTRTRRALLRQCGGPVHGPLGLRQFLLTAKVQTLLSISNFGTLSLFDLLIGLEIGLEEGILNWGKVVDEVDSSLSTSATVVESSNAQSNGSGRVSAADEPLEQVPQMTIEAEAEAVLNAALGRQNLKWREPIGRRFGLHGGAIPTLEQAGEAVGVTRERVRQVQRKASDRLPTKPVAAPAVDQALELLAITLPCRRIEVADALRAAGLTDHDEWTAEALNAVARVTGRTIELVEAGGLVGYRPDLNVVTEVVASAKALSNALGIASIGAVAKRVLARDPDADCSAGSIISALDSASGVHWLDPTHCWFDHASGRNRLVNTSLRILAVNSPQSLSDMHEGIGRHFSFRAASSGGRLADLAAPEIDLLRSFYMSHPAFSFLDDDHVAAVSPMALADLGDEKQALVAILRAQPHQVMDRLSLLAACEEIGMSPSSVTLWITYDESLKRFGPNIWGLRGANVPADVISQLQSEARETHKSFDRRKLIGVTPSGRPWMARKLTPTILYSGVLPFDWGREQLADRTLTMIDMLTGDQVGRSRFSDNFNWGYSGYLRRSAARTGDVLRGIADVDEDTCYLELGGDELLSEPFDW